MKQMLSYSIEHFWDANLTFSEVFGRIINHTPKFGIVTPTI